MPAAPPDPAGRPAPQVLLDLASAYWAAKALSVVAKLGIPDRMAREPSSVAQLAGETGTDEDALYRTLRALATVGVVTEVAPRRFALTALGEHLRSDAPQSVRHLVAMVGDESFAAWADFEAVLATGRPSFPRVAGDDLYGFLAASPDASELFNVAMTERHGALQSELPAAYDFEGMSWIVDVGGGRGTLAATILRDAPALRATVLERPEVVAQACRLPVHDDVSGRLEFVSGDFFRSVPAGADAYLLASVLHNWNDDDARAILEACRRAMTSGSRLLAMEMIVPAGNAAHFSKLLDLNIMVLCDGRERTEAEHRALFASAGLRVDRLIPTGGRITIIEAVPAGGAAPGGISR